PVALETLDGWAASLLPAPVVSVVVESPPLAPPRRRWGVIAALVALPLLGALRFFATGSEPLPEPSAPLQRAAHRAPAVAAQVEPKGPPTAATAQPEAPPGHVAAYDLETPPDAITLWPEHQVVVPKESCTDVAYQTVHKGQGTLRQRV